MKRVLLLLLRSRLLGEYGMVLVLLLLCAYYSVTTVAEQHPSGAAAAEQLAAEMTDLNAVHSKSVILIVAQEGPEDTEFVESLRQRLLDRDFSVIPVQGQPASARQSLEALVKAQRTLLALACTDQTASWAVFQDLERKYPSLGKPRIFSPHSYRWPNFLKASNLLNIANQITVIAIIAVGMTLVIVTGGIDLSVGSLIALAAVVSTWLIREHAGGESASPAAMLGCSLAAIAACALIGALSGALVTFFSLPPFIVTLAMMFIASGLAEYIAENQTIYNVPASFNWLAQGADLLKIPNTMVLILLLYGAAHVLMTRMTLGRYIYAVGGNAEAARLSGVPVRAVLLFVYVACAALAGLGGVVMASRLRSGSPFYGQTYELYVITAVVVGGASLRGGEGKILGTLIGAFIIAVIQNGLNLTGVHPSKQKVVVGAVLLAAVLLDQAKKRGWELFSASASRRPPPASRP